MVYEKLYVGIYVCIILQLAVLGAVNLFERRTQNKILGIFCFLIIISIIKIAFWDPIQQSLFFLIFGGPHAFLLAPLLYSYLLSVLGSDDKSLRPHIIYPLLVYLLIHPMRKMLYDSGISHYEIVPLYLTITLLFTTIYYNLLQFTFIKESNYISTTCPINLNLIQGRGFMFFIFH